LYSNTYNDCSDGYQSEAERTSDCLGFLLAGMETSAFQLAWVIVEVTKDTRVLRKLQQELDSSLPCDKDKFTPEILSGMKYLQQVIKETMRLQPVVAGGMVRQVPKDIEHEGFIIPKGSTANIHYMTLFRQGIREPDKFIPERWEASDLDAEKLKEIYIPFSSGKRNCIGQNLADLELKLLVATLFRSFTFEFTAEIEYEYFQTYKPKNTDLIIRCRTSKGLKHGGEDCNPSKCDPETHKTRVKKSDISPMGINKNLCEDIDYSLIIPSV
jgi:cytochrome P450